MCDVYFGNTCFEAFIFGREVQQTDTGGETDFSSVSRHQSRSTVHDSAQTTDSLETLTTDMYSTDESQVNSYKSDGTTYYHYPPGPMNPRVGFTNPYMYPTSHPAYQVPQQQAYIPNPNYIPPMQSGFTAQQFIPPFPLPQPMSGQENPYMQSIPDYSGQIVNPKRSKSARRRQRQREKKKAKDEAKLKKEEEIEKSSTTKEVKKETEKKEKKEESSESIQASGIYPIMIPSGKGLIPKYVNRKGLTMIENIAYQFQESPDEVTASSQEITDTSEAESLSRHGQWRHGTRPKQYGYRSLTSSSESSLQTSRKTYFLERTSSHQRGRPWPYIDVHKRKLPNTKKEKTKKATVVILGERKLVKEKHTDREKDRSKLKFEEETDISSVEKSLSKLSFQSVDADNCSRITTTDGYVEQSGDNTSTKENLSEAISHTDRRSLDSLKDRDEDKTFKEDAVEDLHTEQRKNEESKKRLN